MPGICWQTEVAAFEIKSLAESPTTMDVQAVDKRSRAEDDEIHIFLLNGGFLYQNRNKRIGRNEHQSESSGIREMSAWPRQPISGERWVRQVAKIAHDPFARP